MKVKSLSHVRLLATPWTAAHQAPPSMGFSRREYWSGVPLPSPPDAGETTEISEVAQLCLTLGDPMDCSPPGSSVHGNFPGKSTGVGCHCLLRYYLEHAFRMVFVRGTNSRILQLTGIFVI